MILQREIQQVREIQHGGVKHHRERETACWSETAQRERQHVEREREHVGAIQLRERDSMFRERDSMFGERDSMLE